jgi:hypothetical protein
MEMRNLMLVAALALLVLSPLAATAQPKATPAPAAPSTAQGVSSNRLLAIGIGALLGVAAGQAIVAGEGITLVGGVAGGLLAAWWYEVGSGIPTRAAMRAAPGAPAFASAQRLASTR